MANEPKIERVLRHLAWLEGALRNPDTPETPYRKVLLTLNAATLLEWYLTFPGPARDAIPGHAAERANAEDLVEAFTDAVRERVRKTERLTADNATTLLGTLADETKALLKTLTTPDEAAPVPQREPEFEVAIDPIELLTEWIAGTSEQHPDAGHEAHLPAAATRPSRHATQYRECFDALLQACAAKKPFYAGKLTADAYATIRRSCADVLERSLEAASEDDGSPELKRVRMLSRPVVEALRRPVVAQTDSRGS